MKRWRLSVLANILFVFLVISSTMWVVTAQSSQSDHVDETHFLENVKLSVFDNLSSERTIQCFDVNEDGWFAIGYRGNEIHIYDENGIFQYGYRFSCNGDYGIELLSQNIVLYFVRGYTVAVFDPDGQLISVEKSFFTPDTLNNTIYKTSEKIGTTTYSLERDLGIFSGDYSRLVSTQDTGEQAVLYDVTNLGYLFGSFHYLILIAFPVLLFIAISSAIKKEEIGTGCA